MLTGKTVLRLLAGLVLLLATSPPDAAAALREASYSWWKLSLGTERSQYLDNDPFAFKDASASTTSLYASIGRDRRWLAIGLNDLRLEQDYWDFRGIRRMFRFRQEDQRGRAVGLRGFYSSGSADFGGWGLGAELEIPLRSTSQRLAWVSSFQRHQMLDPAGNRVQDQYLQECAWHWQPGDFAIQLRWLGQRLPRQISHALYARISKKFSNGAVLSAKALHGRQPFWYDAEDLVLHDSGSALRGLAGLSWKQPMGSSFVLSLATGWEKTDQHEARWAYLGLGWWRGQWNL